jgi:hypothetical protein
MAKPHQELIKEYAHRDVMMDEEEKFGIIIDQSDSTMCKYCNT